MGCTVDDTFQEKRHERDLGRLHPLEGFPIGFVVQRWILRKNGGAIEKVSRFQYLLITSTEGTYFKCYVL